MMLCRHTEPDWVRFVRDPGEGFPIFAACRLLVKAGDPADDPRTIACGYWGRQAECPLYEGPGGSAASAGSASDIRIARASAAFETFASRIEHNE